MIYAEVANTLTPRVMFHICWRRNNNAEVIKNTDMGLTFSLNHLIQQM